MRRLSTPTKAFLVAIFVAISGNVAAAQSKNAVTWSQGGDNHGLGYLSCSFGGDNIGWGLMTSPLHTIEDVRAQTQNNLDETTRIAKGRADPQIVFDQDLLAHLQAAWDACQQSIASGGQKARVAR